MNIIDFFQNLANRWNEENKCGFCWKFSAPHSESAMNTARTEDPCCVHLFLTYRRNIRGYSQNPRVNYLTKAEYCDYYFTLYAVKQSEIGLNVYSEMPEHAIDESLSKTILEPLENCLACGAEIDLCESGYTMLKWDMETTTLHLDSNYTGWKITGAFRKYF